MRGERGREEERGRGERGRREDKDREEERGRGEKREIVNTLLTHGQW